jgi:hypothetical protein
MVIARKSASASFILICRVQALALIEPGIDADYFRKVRFSIPIQL